MTKPIIYEYDAGITCVDAMYIHTGFAACYLMIHEGRAAFFDTGTGNTVPYLLEVLNNKNLPIDSNSCAFRSCRRRRVTNEQVA